MEVIIYTNTGCSACHQAMDYLTTHHVPFVEKSLATDPSARDELVAMGFRAVPVIRVGNETMLGFKVLRRDRMNQRVNAPAVLMALDL